MVTISNDISRIINRRNINAKVKTDLLLEMDANIRTNLGTDSTPKERKQAEENSKAILKGIQKVDWELGGSLLYAMDK